MHTIDDRTARAEMLAALIGLFPWAMTYIEAKRTPLHGVGEFDRIARARTLIEREIGEAEALRQLGEPRHVRARFKRGAEVGTLAEFLDRAGTDFDLAGYLKCAKVGETFRGIRRIR